MPSIIISILALIVSVVTFWLTLFRRGNLLMTKPVMVGFLYDLPAGEPKVFFRALLFATGKRGHIVQSMFLKVRRGESVQTFNFWMYGERAALMIGSGLRVSEDGVACNHHFLPPKDGNAFAFLPGDYVIEIYACIVQRSVTMLLSSVRVTLTQEGAADLKSKTNGVLFTLGAGFSAVLRSHRTLTFRGTGRTSSFFSIPGATPMKSADQLVGKSAPVLALIAGAGGRAARRFLEYLTVNIRNKNTRAAYGRAAADFLHWCEGKGISDLGRVQPVHVAAYIELLRGQRSAPTVKQHLACIRMLFDRLVVGQVMPTNPAHSVRGPRHTVTKGVTPVLSSEEATALLTGMDISTVVGLRGRAIIAAMTYTFARVGAVVALTVEDYFSQKKRWWLRLHEKKR